MTNYAETVATKRIECGQCTDECDFLIAYGKKPKELADEALKTNFSDDPVLPYSCNICGYCQKLCPENLDLGLMIMEAREKLVSERIGPLPGHQPAIEGQEFYVSDNFRIISAGTVLHQLDQKIIYPHYDFKHLTEKYFEIGMKLDDFLIQLVKY